jgi:hypothetical protein
VTDATINSSKFRRARNMLIPPSLRSRIRWIYGRERLALFLDRLCGEDTP